ncbi:hypothetical protein UFOVP328_217 [uncultured Caudovirales phage]|uniref:Uncharacterized protein n=1 Tax=uncultured Caudovirales phage TaxID=2100421 RepID=A0A6J5LTX3_9CAUD|nr:hypothetical protein UFOVP328_217 [uncultured Caudovirales phage]
MNETTQNFLEVWNSLDPWTAPVVLFRLYYDDLGAPIEYSHEDKPGNYIDVDPETFRIQSWNVRVVNTQLIKVLPKIAIDKLVPDSDAGTTCSDKDVCIVVSHNEPHTKWSLKRNETN